ncbi:MAG: acyl-CoA dehydrogenase family protein, partial [Thermoplasmata archaeon]
MIDFTPSEEQKLLVQTAHEFAEKEMRPVALEYDQKGEMPWDVIEKAHKLGLTSAYIPEKYGGGGMVGTLSWAMVMEELNWGCAGISTGLIGGGLAFLPIMYMGTEEQKERF